MPIQLTLQDIASGSQITALDASKLSGTLPAISGANLTGLVSSLSGQTDATVSTSDPSQSENPSVDGHLWVNKTAGSIFICTDNTAGSNVWEAVGAGPSYAESSSAPSSPTNGDLWYDTDDEILYQRQVSNWIQISTGSMPGVTLEGLTDTTVSVSDPTTSSNPSATGHYWINKTSGECFICTDATAGSNVWTNIGDGTGSISDPYMSATGGTITTDGNYKIHTFNSSATFTPTTGADATYGSIVEYLVVAGGAGGGNGGGGGAGGYRTATSFSVSNTGYSITVGAGGASATNGSNSVFSSITSIGGGTGGSYGNPYGSAGSSGGSGGGGGAGESGSGAVSGGSGTSGQGNAGGTGYNYEGRSGAGGGGAGTSGGNGGVPYVSGNGGNGLSSSITGSPVTRGGGGGGFSNVGAGNSGGYGGTGGGGTGRIGGGTNAGGVNTGGGGGASYTSSNTGGSGIVIIRYKYQQGDIWHIMQKQKIHQ